MALHESQSLSFEMQLARSGPFVRLIAPLVLLGALVEGMITPIIIRALY